MVYDIEEISTDKATGMTYVLVHFWPDAQSKARGEAPSLVNDFLIHRNVRGSRVIRDAQGRAKLKDGTFKRDDDFDGQEEFEREDFEIDMASQITSLIERYIPRFEARQYRGDHTGDATKPAYINGRLIPQSRSVHIERDDSDPHGIFSQPGMVSIRQQIATRREAARR